MDDLTLQAKHLGVSFTRINEDFGAEVSGMDLSGGISEAEGALVKNALDRFLLLRFRQQTLEPVDEAKVVSFVVSKSEQSEEAGGVLNIIQEVPEVEMNEIYRDYAWVHSSLVGGIAAIVAERDSDNRPDHSELPPVLPHQLVVLRGRDISAIVSGQRERLLTSWTLEDIDYIEQDHSDLLEEYKNDTVFKSAIERTSFKTAWSCVPSGKFTNLRRFVGGLATVFPTTSSVESDFSIVKWEKNVTRQSLTDFSLEGVLQSKQYARLEEMNI
ncbi:hypothetical protein BSKO_01955 [Bryopsis sp. KO-2023]|nr:hypothetical protein BSKO_01955 [Bryopsis sp. KO-2023]